MSVKVTRRMAQKAVLQVLGPTGRVWKNSHTPPSYSIGFELNPGRNVIGSGPTLIEAFADAFLETDAIKAEADRIEAARQAPPPDLTTGQPEASEAILEGVQG